jgi:hypothetical protein
MMMSREVKLNAMLLHKSKKMLVKVGFIGTALIKLKHGHVGKNRLKFFLTAFWGSRLKFTRWSYLRPKLGTPLPLQNDYYLKITYRLIKTINFRRCSRRPHNHFICRPAKVNQYLLADILGSDCGHQGKFGSTVITITDFIFKEVF